MKTAFHINVCLRETSNEENEVDEKDINIPRTTEITKFPDGSNPGGPPNINNRVKSHALNVRLEFQNAGLR